MKYAYHNIIFTFWNVNKLIMAAFILLKNSKTKTEIQCAIQITQRNWNDMEGREKRGRS